VIFLADTNVLSELRKRERANERVRIWAAVHGWSAIHTSWIAIAEMKRGAALVARRDPIQAAALERWISEVLDHRGDRVFPVERSVAEAWAHLMIPNTRPAMDALIAATALVHGLTLATRNVRDFKGSGISVLDPWTFER
jgi:predicted nucleic acid-binding protein